MTAQNFPKILRDSVKFRFKIENFVMKIARYEFNHSRALITSIRGYGNG